MVEGGGKSNALTIRRMTEDDVASAAMIDLLSFSLPWSEYAFRHEVTGNENARAWVAEVQSESGSREVIGVTVVWLVLDEAHIGTIAIHPNHRREGVGKQLMNYALAEAANEGAVLVYLEVRRSNLPAIHLYQEMGFETVGVRKKYYQDNGEDALLMTLPDLKSMVSNI